MAEEPQVSLPTEEPRRCPACGSRVAALATTCLMCGTSLVEGEPTPEQPEKKGLQRLPGLARALIVVILALAILSAGSFGLYTLMDTEPEEATPTATPTRTLTPTPTSTPSPTPLPTSTPTPVPPLVHQVQEGETLIVIAEWVTPAPTNPAVAEPRASLVASAPAATGIPVALINGLTP